MHMQKCMDTCVAVYVCEGCNTTVPVCTSVRIQVSVLVCLEGGNEGVVLCRCDLAHRSKQALFMHVKVCDTLLLCVCVFTYL